MTNPERIPSYYAEINSLSQPNNLQPNIPIPTVNAQTNSIIRNNELEQKLSEQTINNDFLKIVLKIMREKVMLNKQYISSIEDLKQAIALLTGTNLNQIEIIESDLLVETNPHSCGLCKKVVENVPFIFISKVLVTKNGKTEDLKYGYNYVYSTFLQYRISLKIAK